MATANPLGVLSQDLMWIINTITAPRLYFVRCSVTLQIRDISTFHLLGQSLANTFTERDIINTIYKSRSLYCFQDRKSTRLNSSHANISYAVFCLKKKTERQMFGLQSLHRQR